jgi:hypothetical protein
MDIAGGGHEYILKETNIAHDLELLGKYENY